MLILAPVFSGLAEGLSQGRWTPRGVPAFYKLIEGLEAAPHIAVTTILSCKEPDARFQRVTRYRFTESGEILVLPWRSVTRGRFRKVERLITEAEQLLRIWFATASLKPNLVYATYGMVLVASILARWSRKPVVLRLMGLFPQHRDMLNGAFPLFRWAMKAPFATVICTEDGSDPKHLLPKLIAPNIPLEVRLNGCDLAPLEYNLRAPKDPLRIIFLGRLTRYKGANIFVKSVKKAALQNTQIDIIGDGPERENLEELADDSVQFHGALPHHEVLKLLSQADIYVSVNLHGNLSNANLEALAAGCALVIPTPDTETPIDTATLDLIPETAAVRFERGDAIDSLAASLQRLAADRSEVERLRMASRDVAQTLLRPWRSRIEADIELLKTLASAKADATKRH